MGKEDEAKKPKVIGIIPSQARVVSVRSGAKIIREEGRLRTTTLEAETFSRQLRERLGLRPTDPFTSSHLQQLAEELELTPVAFLNIKRGHWTLVVAYKPGKEGGVEIFDPNTGLREFPNSELVKTESSVWYFPSKGHVWFGGNGLRKVSEEGYELPEEPLRALGKIQNNPSDCGALCVYAAKIAKGV